jgi:hypothetical protein
VATLKELIHQGATGSSSENDNRWRLCYDTHVGRFYVEHVVDSPLLGYQQQSAVIKKHAVASWNGPGAAAIPEAKARLLERANS